MADQTASPSKAIALPRAHRVRFPPPGGTSRTCSGGAGMAAHIPAPSAGILAPEPCSYFYATIAYTQEHIPKTRPGAGPHSWEPPFREYPPRAWRNPGLSMEEWKRIGNSRRKRCAATRPTVRSAVKRPIPCGSGRAMTRNRSQWRDGNWPRLSATRPAARTPATARSPLLAPASPRSRGRVLQVSQ
jgi:hypothetical protein